MMEDIARKYGKRPEDGNQEVSKHAPRLPGDDYRYYVTTYYRDKSPTYRKISEREALKLQKEWGQGN